MTKKLGNIGIIGGAGWLGSLLAERLLQANFCNPQALWIGMREIRELSLKKHWPAIHITHDLATLVKTCDTIILSVKPYDILKVMLPPSDKLFISVMAGVSIDQLKKQTKATKIIRAMPNVAAEIGQSYTPWYAAFPLNQEEQTTLASFFKIFGLEDQCQSEDQLNFLTALTGSGQGWIAYLEHCFIQCGIANGLSESMAKRAVQQLFIGIATQLRDKQESLEPLIKTLVDYAGTTAAGLIQFKQSNIREAIAMAMTASYHKAKSDMTKR